jgi:hypothetical protein
MARSRASGRPQLTGADGLLIAAGTLCLIAGLLVLLVGAGFAASIVGAGLLGLAGIAFVSLAFLLVGESEDREREPGKADRRFRRR